MTSATIKVLRSHLIRMFLVQTVHALEVTEKKQMYRGELIGLEEKVKEIAEQIEELLKSMRELVV